MKKLFSAILFFTLFVQSSFAQWYEQTSGITTALYSVSGVDDSVAWTCGASGKVLRTINGGNNWLLTTSPNSTLDLYNIWGIDSANALVTGSSSSTTYIYKTTDGGINWFVVFTQQDGFVDAIVELDTDVFGMVGDPVGGRWSIWISPGGGFSWDSTGFYLPQSGNEAGWNNSLFSLYGTSSGWIGTNSSHIYYSSNAGASFVAQPTPGLTNSYAVWFNTEAVGMTGGTILLFTTNSGMNWTPITAPGTGNILGITGENTNWWYVRGSGIYYSTNNGANWTLQHTAPSGAYQHIAKARNGIYIWAVRDNGGISRTPVPIGVEPVSGQIPDRFNLYQNYPNPFNPVTKIKFDVPSNLTLSGAKGLSVRLMVFDILGREVVTLVNEQLKPGNYEVDWNASDFSSGTYFYKLTAGDFSETKRMILLK